MVFTFVWGWYNTGFLRFWVGLGLGWPPVLDFWCFVWVLEFWVSRVYCRFVVVCRIVVCALNLIFLVVGV